MSRVVSLTPASVQADSRTFKQAASVARLGHESIVIEALPSTALPPGLPFAVRTIQSLGDRLAAPGADRAPEAPATGTPATGAPAAPARIARATALARRLTGPLYVGASMALANVHTARRLPSADLVWLHGFEQFPAVWLRRLPFVYDAHDFYPALAHDGRTLSPAERGVQRLRLALERACLRRAAVRVTTSERMAALYREHAGGEWTVLRNAQDRRLDADSDGDVRSAAAVPASAYLLVMVAAMKHGLAIKQAARALDELDADVHLAFVGPGFDAAPRHPRLHVLGPVAPERIRSFLRSADACALLYATATANTVTQLPNGFFHAVNAELPLLAPRAMPEVVDLTERLRLGVVVDAADPASIAAGVRDLRAGTWETAATELSWEAEERTLAAVLAQAGLRTR